MSDLCRIISSPSWDENELFALVQSFRWSSDVDINCSRRTRVYTTCLADEITGNDQFRIPTSVLLFISEAVVSTLPPSLLWSNLAYLLDFPDGICPFLYSGVYGNTRVSAVFAIYAASRCAAYDHALFSFRVGSGRRQSLRLRLV